MPRIKIGKPGPSLPVIKSLRAIKPLRPLPLAKAPAPMSKRAIRPPLMKR